jgi:hypothetical protein
MRGLRRRPQLVNLPNDAGMHASPPKFNPAAGKPRQPLNILCLRRPQHDDPVVTQIPFIIESSRVAVISSRMQLGENTQPRAIGKCKWSDGRLARPACTIRSIEAGREPALSLPKGRPSLHELGILHLLVNCEPHPSPHRPTRAIARDRFRLHVNGFANRPRPRRPRISLPHHPRRECNGSPIRQTRNAGSILLKSARRLTPNLNQKSAQKKPRTQSQPLGQPSALRKKPRRRKNKSHDRNYPPKRRPPNSHSHPQSK